MRRRPGPEQNDKAPSNPRRLSFTTKVACAALLTTLGILSVGSGGFMLRQWRVERQELVAQRTLAAEMLADQAAVALVFNDRPAAGETLSSASRVPDFRWVQIFDSRGRLFAQSGGPGLRAQGVEAPQSSASGNALEVRVPIRVDQERVGELVLSSGTAAVDRSLGSYAVFTLLLFLVLSSLSLGAAFWVAKRVVEPVRRLIDGMREVRLSGDFGRSVEVRSNDELGLLTSEFNHLLSELQTTVADLVSARDQAESANRLKTEFLANMSHELRTPLNGVLGLAEVMAFDELSAAQRERLEVIRQSGGNLLALLNDLLDIAKIEAGKLELEDTEFDLAHSAEAACELFQAEAEKKGFPLLLSVSDEADGLWRGDPFRIQQVLGNLISNAVKFTRTGQVEVTVSVEPGETENVVLAVSDTGIGIPADKISQLFEKFTQADNSTTRVFGGTGLGLSICRGLVAQMGGTVSVASNEEVGSTFRVRLPLARAAKSASRSGNAACRAASSGEKEPRAA